MKVEKLGAYQKRSKTPGGSPKGTRKYKWPLKVKAFLHFWALDTFIPGKHEALLYAGGVRGLFSTSYWKDFPFQKVFPGAYAKYLKVHETPENLHKHLMNRFHKMYYDTREGNASTGRHQFSKEHPEIKVRYGTDKEAKEVCRGRSIYKRWRASR